MKSTDALGQLLRSLCHNTCWNYAVFWKLEPRNHMLLTWEDGYFDNEKSNDVVGNTLHNEFPSGKVGTISFCSEIDAWRGDSEGCPIEVAVASLSCHTYLLGEGIVGKVALNKKHHWIFAGEYSSKLMPECPAEWELQFAAGIKTILLVPFIPRGIVQLGSLHTVMEDSTVVSRIRDLFSNRQLITETCISFATRVDHINPYAPVSMPPMGTLSASSAFTGDLLDPAHLPLSAKTDSTAFYFGQLMRNESSTIGTHFQADLPLSQSFNNQIQEMDMNHYTDESLWMAMCGDLVVDLTEKPFVLNQSIYTDNIVMGDIPEVLCLDNEIDGMSTIAHGFTAKWPTVPNSYMKEQEHSDLCFVKHMMSEDFLMELTEEASGRHLNFPFHCELHKALGLDSMEEHDGVQREVLEACGSLDDKAGEHYLKESETKHLLDAVLASLHYDSDDGESDISRCVRSCSNSSGNFPGSCLTQCKTDDDIFGLEDSVLCTHKGTTPFPNSDGRTNSPTGSSRKRTISLLINEEQHNSDMADGHNKGGLKSSQSSKRKGRSSEVQKPRPRDRQLIQDRLKELRELIPNGSKCSIDVLLDRTVKHMSFLRSIPCRAEKLRHSAYPKACQNGASWAYEVGGGPRICPLVVENLEQPGQILVEMLCKEYGLFLEVVQVIKCLKLTILKGVLESRSDKLWAHFVIEASRGFHRMDILLPLMQLLQRS